MLHCSILGMVPLGSTKSVGLLPLLCLAQVLLLVLYAFMGACLLRDYVTPIAASSSSGSSGAAKQGAEAAQAEGAPVLLPHEWAYLYGLVPLEVYCSMLHPLLLHGALPFVPLMLTSVYCALGMVYAWGRMAAPFVADAAELARPRGRRRPKRA